MFIKYLHCVKGYTYILSLISHTMAALYITTNTGHSGVPCSVLSFVNISLKS